MDFTCGDSNNSNSGQFNPFLRFYEHEWIESTARILEGEDDEYGEELPVRIFTVPKTLISLNKEAYTPQLVAIGPYHQKQVDLYAMTRYKISSAKRTQKLLKTRRIRDVVEHFYELEYHIRACYDRFLDHGREALAWTMVIDASFLLEYMQIYTKGMTLTKVPHAMSHLFDHTGRKSGHQTILKDIVKLENQIPLFVLRGFLGFCQVEKPDELFAEMLKGICEVLSPIKSMDNFPSSKGELFERAHLLDLLYYVLLPPVKGDKMVAVEIGGKDGEIQASEYNDGWKRLLEQVVEEVEIVDSKATPPLDEHAIPTVTELSNVGIKFRPAKGGLNSIKFDKYTATVYLPVIVMGDISNVVLRNLSAYEASVAPERMALSRFIDLMNEFIDTEKDVKLLKEDGIILNHLKSDVEVANLWNGMSKSAERTKEPDLDGTIKSINTYYSAKLKVKAASIFKKYVQGSWKVLIFFAANIFLLLSVVQAICSVRDCKRLGI